MMAHGGVSAECSRPRLLIVDDEGGIVRALVRALQRGWDIDTCGSAEAALERIEAGERYDVVLSDLRLPVMSGGELYGALCARAPRLAGRFVLMSGNDDSTGVGGVPIVAKPFDLDELEQTLARVLERPADGGDDACERDRP